MQISAQAKIMSKSAQWTPPADASCCSEVRSEPVDSFIPTERDEADRKKLGELLWSRYLDGQIDLLPVQVSGRNDGADARSNIADTAVGKQAKRSTYGNAPGGRISLTFTLLDGLKTLSDEYSFRVTAMVGGSHSKRSRHYLGVAMDVDTIDGRRVDKNHPKFRDFMKKARAMGATEVLGPGSRGHDRHIHIAWPRDAKLDKPRT